MATTPSPAPATTPAQLIRRIAAVERILEAEERSAKGKLRDSVAQIRSREPFCSFPVVFLPAVGQAIFVGDTHGDSLAVSSIIRHERFEERLAKGEALYLVCLGDYADRGREDLKNIEMLLALKQRYPQSVYLLRGNHEEHALGQYYGLLGSCIRRLGYDKGQLVFQRLNEFFEMLPAIVVCANGVVGVHGGVPIGDTHTLRAIGDDESLEELRWNDPTEEVDRFVFNYRRGSHYLFGPQLFTDFMAGIGGTVMVRAHEYVAAGYKFLFDHRLVSIFSNGGTSPESGYRDFILTPKYIRVDLSKRIERWSAENVHDVPYG
ncbi:MAG: metallophosphoesterase family protein [Patescibacteria group bacterium]